MATTGNVIARLMKELDITSEQAEGAAGLLLQVAQARMPQEDFLQVADSIPAISDIIAKAPRFVVPARSRLRAKLSRLLGGLGSLAPLAEPFARLRLEKTTIPQCTAVLLAHFQERGGDRVESHLREVWR